MPELSLLLGLCVDNGCTRKGLHAIDLWCNLFSPYLSSESSREELIWHSLLAALWGNILYNVYSAGL